MILRALRAIEPGEEITYDYGEEYFALFIKPNGCRCAKCADDAKLRASKPRSANQPRAAKKRRA